MKQTFLKLAAWVHSQHADTIEQKTLYKEVVRRARTAEIISPWYNRFSFTYIPTVVIAFCAVLFISYNTGTNSTTILPMNTSETGVHEYQVLSAYEHADKIAKEKAGLQKIINTLPVETITSTVATELLSIEKYIQEPTDTETDTVSEPKKDTSLVISSKLESPTKEIIIDNKKLDISIKEKVSEYYQKIKTSQEKGDLTETLILIGEVKKIIADEQEIITPENKSPVEKDIQKKQ